MVHEWVALNVRMSNRKLTSEMESEWTLYTNLSCCQMGNIHEGMQSKTILEIEERNSSLIQWSNVTWFQHLTYTTAKNASGFQWSDSSNKIRYDKFNVLSTIDKGYNHSCSLGSQI